MTVVMSRELFRLSLTHTRTSFPFVFIYTERNVTQFLPLQHLSVFGVIRERLDLRCRHTIPIERKLFSDLRDRVGKLQMFWCISASGLVELKKAVLFECQSEKRKRKCPEYCWKRVD